MDAMLQGREQASREANRQQMQRQQQQTKGKRKSRFRWDSMERGYER
ncbi:hypothetical protein [Paenisporosarcina sp. OV554]|nr:hypothetical protein [Paenisporosarcina sp. OV554]